MVLKFDASQLERPLNPQPPRSPDNIFRQHDVRFFVYSTKPFLMDFQGSIRGIAPHPTQDDIFITGRFVPASQ